MQASRLRYGQARRLHHKIERSRAHPPAAGDRIKTAGDILEYVYFFVVDDKLVYDEKAVAKSLQKPARPSY